MDDPVDFRDYDIAKLWREIEERDLSRGFQPATIPPMTPTFWRTMDEEIFRDIMKSNMRMLTGLASLKAIRERCKELGIEAP